MPRQRPCADRPLPAILRAAPPRPFNEEVVTERTDPPPDPAAAALEAYNRTRGRLPRAARVAARPNVRRLASLTGRGAGPPTLNLATAVLDAGEEAWVRVAPALRGDREALLRLRKLADPGLAEARRTRPRTPRRALPEPACDGTDEQRDYLRTLIAFVRETSGHADAFPEEVRLRISRRMTSSLGLCARAGDTHRITIAERLFRPGLEEILFDTVKHELAHLADQATSENGRSSHGPRWKEWARRLGARPERLGPSEVARRVERVNRKTGRGFGGVAGRRLGWGREGERHRVGAPVLPAWPDEVRRWLASR